MSCLSTVLRWSYVVVLALVVVSTAGCVGAKYKAMLEAAQSELSPGAIAQDDLHKIHIHEAMVAEQGLSGLTLSINVFMERAYLVGHVDNKEQGEAVLKTARHVQGIRSVEGYLPVTAPSANGNAVSDKTSDVSLKAQVLSALTLEPKVVKSRVHVEVLDGHVVLLGVVSGEPERHHAETAAAGVEGVKTVMNWLLLPEKGYMTHRKKIR